MPGELKVPVSTALKGMAISLNFKPLEDEKSFNNVFVHF